MLQSQENDHVRICNALEKVTNKGQFLSSIINENAVSKTVKFFSFLFRTDRKH